MLTHHPKIHPKCWCEYPTVNTFSVYFRNLTNRCDLEWKVFFMIFCFLETLHFNCVPCEIKKKSLRTTELNLLTEEPPSSQPKCLDVTVVLSWCCYRNKKTLISPCSSMVLFLFGKGSCNHRSYNKCRITIMLSVSPRMLPVFLYGEGLPPKVCQSSETY